MRKILIIITFLLPVFLYAQTTICLGDDASACVGTQITIDANCAQSGGSAIQNTIYTLNNPQSFSLGDDDFTSTIDLGFTFKFFGQNYTQIIIADNGFISFNVANAGGYASWSTSTIPTTTTSLKNTIMSCWEDLYQPAGGNIYFQTLGTAPNRIAVVFFDGLSKFSTSCQTPDICYTGAILLFEGSNRIEMHISNKTVCTAWGGGTAVQGVNNSTGTIGIATPGRNNTMFSIQNDGRRYTPAGANSYTVSQIPFAIVNTTTNPGIVWEDTEGNSYPFNNGNLTVTVPNTTQDSVGYFISSSTCGVGAAGLSDTTWITPLSSSVTATATDDICTSGNGSVTAVPSSGLAPYTYVWPTLGNATTATVNNVSPGTYNVVMTDSNGCVSNATATVGDTPATFTGSSTLVSCPGGADGTATATMTPPMGTITYQWNDPAAQTAQTATGLSAGNYQCIVTSDIGCTGTVNVQVDEVPPMQLQVVNQQDVTCNSGNDGIATIEVTDGSAPYTYSWTGSASTAATANDLAASTTTVTVTDVNGCTISQAITINQPDPVSISNISQDTIICIGDSVNLFVNANGGSSAYTYEWKLNGNVVGTQSNIYVTPQDPVNRYYVVVGEACGSPTVMDSVQVNYPEPVNIGVLPDTVGGCYPVTIQFDNTTTTQENVDYTIWSYSDGAQDTVAGLQSATHEFGQGLYDVNLEIVTDRGCHYSKNYPQLIEGYEHPEANFYVTPNPATILEPTVHAFGRTSSDIIAYQWYADSSAEPFYSSLQNPTFVYPSEVGNHNLLLVVKNGHQCVDSLEKIVQIVNNVLIFAPNSFTPDGDNFNNQWKVVMQGIDIYSFHLIIFNRWGETVFESFDKDGAWDGTYGGRIVPEGTYVWKIEAKDAINDNKYQFKGTVNVIR